MTKKEKNIEYDIKKTGKATETCRLRCFSCYIEAFASI